MKRLKSVTTGGIAALMIMSIGAPLATATTGVQYASGVGVAPGISNLLSTSGHEHRTFNTGANWYGSPPSNGVNLPIKVRILLQAGGETTHVGGVNIAPSTFPAPGPKGKAQCWVPTHAGGYGGVLNCYTDRP